MKRVMVIHGPNLNMLGNRNPKVYGENSLEAVNDYIAKKAKELKIEVDFFQSNCEGKIINKIHKIFNGYSALIINPGAYTHYSYAIRDAIESIDIPTIEVHISNIYKREAFRSHSVIAPVSMGQISGLGIEGYILALEKIARL
jgi:3-dehydroquinate dehydratase II